MSSSEATPAAVYRARAGRFGAEAAAFGRQSRRLSWARLGVAAGVAGCLLALVVRAGSPPGWAAAGTVGLGVVFAVLMRVHGRAIAAERRAAALARLQQYGLARLERAWERLPVAAGSRQSWVGRTPQPGASEARAVSATAGATVATGSAPPPQPAVGWAPPAGRASSDRPDREGAEALARDLDLFGPASLYHLLDPGMTPAGGAALAGWLLAPAAPVEIAARQQAVAELAPELDHRQRLALAAVGAERLAGDGSEPPAAETPEGWVGGSASRPAPAPARHRPEEPVADPERFFAWAEGEPWLLRRPALIWASWVMPPVALGGVVAAAAGAIPWSLAALPLLVNLTLSYGFAKTFHRLFDAVDAGAGQLRAYAAALEVAAGGPTASRRLRELASALGAARPSPSPGDEGDDHQTGPDARLPGTSPPYDDDPHDAGTQLPEVSGSDLGHPTQPLESLVDGAIGANPPDPANQRTARAARPAHRELARLARRVEIADARHGSFHVIPQMLLLWDLHALRLLEGWQRGPGRRARRWLGALGEIEALAALAGLAHDQPDWAFPEVDETAGRLTARDLGHPLIADPARVGNDVEIGPAGGFLLVTGSNMSGKSTLLRALGVDAVLAQAGGPVCAAAMRLPPVALGTSILVEDSLADGVSFFLAEVLRIRGIVELARRAPEAGRTPLFLIDEPLRGTNSRERRAASQRVLHHLLAAGAIGAVATHDLELAADPELAAAARPVHFRETIAPGGDGGRPVMSFDYRLRPGLATTTNALALLELVGLDDPAPPAGGG